VLPLANWGEGEEEGPKGRKGRKSVEGATDPGCRSDESGETDLPHAGEELGQAAEAEGHADDDIGVLQVISQSVSGAPSARGAAPRAPEP
jgi:hypothetical protein